MASNLIAHRRKNFESKNPTVIAELRLKAYQASYKAYAKILLNEMLSYGSAAIVYSIDPESYVEFESVIIWGD